jgi:Tfp pilus assembly protein PilF
MPNTVNEWTLDGFVDHFDFVHHKMLDHKFVWVLGAGASYASGIPLGSQLVDEWLKELHLREDREGTPLSEWATDVRLGIKNFDFEQRASFYPRIYERRFREYPDEGYAYLESVMSGKDPSPGYSVLASALALDPPRHNVVITTNFDNLVADALSIYTDTFPFVAGHESLTSFVRVSMRRPLICKIHRDLLLGPQNDSRSLKRLHDAWGTALRALFQHYTPVFIGYGGNDDTLMDLLESFQPADIKGELIWCYYEQQKPSERIGDVVTELNGILVPAPDFDLLMILLGERMEIKLLDEEIGRRSTKRTKKYRERIQELDTVKHPSVTKALAATFDRSGGWWAWYRKAEAEQDLERREIVYRQGLIHCPKSAELHGSFANFLNFFLHKADEAELEYQRALDLDPNNPAITGNYANFMIDVRKNPDEAERLYRLGLESDPKNADNIGNYAAFVSDVRKNPEEAELLYRRALELNPKQADNNSNYVGFLIGQNRLDEALERLEIATALNDNKQNQLAAELALYSAILFRLRGQDDSSSVRKLRELLSKGFTRSPMLFEGVLAFARDKLPQDDYKVLAALADAIVDPSTYATDTILPQR